MKEIFIIALIIAQLSLFAERSVLVDCIHGANYYVDWDSGNPVPIDFESMFSEYEITKITSQDIILDEILYDVIEYGTQNLTYDVVLPSIPEYPIAIYVIIESQEGMQNFATGVITSPDSEVVAEMFNNLMHYDNVSGTGWSINLTLPSDGEYHIVIGYGSTIFSMEGTNGYIDLSDYDSIIRINDQSYFAIRGNCPDYSEQDLYSITEAFSQGTGFLNLVNMYDGFMDKPFIHFESEEDLEADLKINISGERSMSIPNCRQEESTLEWRKFPIRKNSVNEIVYEARLASKLNFLYFKIDENYVNISNNTEYPIKNLTLIKYKGNGDFQYGELDLIGGKESISTNFSNQANIDFLKNYIKDKFYKEAIISGLSSTEADHLVNDYYWIEALFRRAKDNPEKIFGFYHFGEKLYNMLAPIDIKPRPQKSSRNMWVMLSNITNRDMEEIIGFPNRFESNESCFKGLSMREYGVIDEYYEREDNFFGIQIESFLNSWTIQGIEFFNNEIAGMLSDNVNELSISGQYAFSGNEECLELLYETASLETVGMTKNVQENGKLIMLGTSEYFRDVEDNIQFLNNCLNYITDYNSNLEEECEANTPIITDIKSYPNPYAIKSGRKRDTQYFNIQFTLVEESNVKIEIYDIKGKRIKTVENSLFAKGVNSIVWNGKNSENSLVNTGIYFYKIKAKGYEKVSKMIIIR